MILIDTCTYLFAAYEPAKLSSTARRILMSRENRLVWSVASTWELAIKAHLGRIETPGVLRDLDAGLAELGATVLPVEQVHALRVATLPAVHEDPFDRMLVAQALVERLPILSSDTVLPEYPGVDVRW